MITTVLRKLRETATITVLQERNTRSKSISEFMECHKTYKDEKRMTKIQTFARQIPHPSHHHRSNTSSEAPRRTIKEIGNAELYEPGDTFRIIQCPSCLKYSKQGTVCCFCGIFLMPSTEQTEKVKDRIGIISNPLFIIIEGQSGERHGPKWCQ